MQSNKNSGSGWKLGGVLLLLVAATTLADGGPEERVSVASTGVHGNAGSEIQSPQSVSADGRFVVFVSAADNLVPGDTNQGIDVFVRDRLTGTTERVSVTSGGAQAAGWYDMIAPTSMGASISADGRYVAFLSDAANLISEELPEYGYRLYVRDRVAGTTEVARISASGVPAVVDFDAPFDGRNTVISSDGRYVGFSSYSDELVPGDTNDEDDVFVWDRLGKSFERVSISSAGREGHDPVPGLGFITRLAVSADGRFVAFVSRLTGLVPEDTDLRGDVFVRDRVAGTTARVSALAGGGAPSNSDPLDGALAVALSADGRFLAFTSAANDLAPGDTNNQVDLFVRDRATGLLERVNVSTFGTPSDESLFPFQVLALQPSLSADGRFVAFTSRAADLVPGEKSAGIHVFVRDRLAGTTERVSVSADLRELDDFSFLTSISADGRCVAFGSATDNRNLGGPPSPGIVDLFLAERSLTTPPSQIVVFRPSNGQWLLREDDASASTVAFGGAADQPTPADYLGTGFAQVATFRPASGEWRIRNDAGQTVGPIRFGQNGDVPLPADYLGLRRAQIAVFRPRTGQWLIRSDTGAAIGPIPFGQQGDQPVPADYLGLGMAQIAVFHSQGRGPGLYPPPPQWLIRGASGAALAPITFGAVGDIPVPGDYLGLGHAQIAVFRPSTAEWLVRQESGATLRIPFGTTGDLPVPGDYLGGRPTQIAVYRPSTGEWFLRLADGETLRLGWGGPGDRPLPAAFARRFDGR